MLLRVLRGMLLCIVLVGGVTACDDSDYHYPDVRQEYLTARSGPDGYLETVMTDAGVSYAVLNPVAAPNQAADTTLRVVANYVCQSLDNGSTGALLYAVQTALSPFPRPAEMFAEGVKTDPASMLSIWMGLDYLNIVLEIKTADGAHEFHFVEERAEYENARGDVSLSLYHDANGDPPYYTRRVYLSVPLRQYAVAGVDTVAVRFSLRNYADETETYSFAYVPQPD